MSNEYEELKKQIFERFGDKLKDVGADVEIIEANGLPDDKELSKKKQYIESLGHIKNGFVSLIKKGFTIVTIWVVTGEIPGTIKTYETLYIPRTFEIVEQIMDAMKNETFFDTDEDYIDKSPILGLVIVDPNWIGNKVKFDKDKSETPNQVFSFPYREGSYALPVSGSTMTSGTDLTILDELEKA